MVFMKSILSIKLLACPSFKVEDVATTKSLINYKNKIINVVFKMAQILLAPLPIKIKSWLLISFMNMLN